MKKIIIGSLIIILLLLVVAVTWGLSTNFGKSFNPEEASRYCYSACLNQDRIKYCTPELIVNFEERGKWENVSCQNLAVNNIVGPCQEVTCP